MSLWGRKAMKMGDKGTERRRGLFDPKRLAAPEVTARATLDAAVEAYDPAGVYALFSGGHDSRCAYEIARRHPRFTGAIHVNTGIGIEQTREYVRETCRRDGVTLYELHPPAPDYATPGQGAYEAYVVKYGFPSPRAHGTVYEYLKQRALNEFVAKQLPDELLLFITGVRRQESERRMRRAIYQHPTRREGRIVWCSPLIDWWADDKRDFFKAHSLPRNRISDILCKSGECLCGCFSQPGEIEDIRKVEPATAAGIERLQGLVRAALGGRWKASVVRRLAFGTSKRFLGIFHGDGVADVASAARAACEEDEMDGKLLVTPCATTWGGYDPTVPRGPVHEEPARARRRELCWSCDGKALEGRK